MIHADLLKLLLPPVSYAPYGAGVGSELTAEGNALDAALAFFNKMKTESFPDATVELLPQWENAYGLPDMCTGAVPTTLIGRQTILNAKVNAHGGLSSAYFVILAANLGYSITINGFLPNSVDDDCDASMWDENWRYAWQVNAASNTVSTISVDDDTETPLSWWGNDLLECMCKRLGPAHMQVIFSYI